MLVSRYWGMMGQNPEKAAEALKKTVCIMIRLTVSLALVFAVATFLIPKQIMFLYSDDPAIIDNGVIYFRYSIDLFLFRVISGVYDCASKCRTGEASASCFDWSLLCEPWSKLRIDFW